MHQRNNRPHPKQLAASRNQKPAFFFKNLLPLLHSELRSVLFSGLGPRPSRPTPRRGSQVVRQESAKLLCVGSIPTPASILARVTSTSCAGFHFFLKFCGKGCETRSDTTAQKPFSSLPQPPLSLTTPFFHVENILNLLKGKPVQTHSKP